MPLPRKRLALPTSLLVSILSGAPLAGCSPSPAQDASVDVVQPSDGCTQMQCLQGPLPICDETDAAVTACMISSNCTAAFAANGVYLGQQCYGSCVTSTLADGATSIGFC